MKLLKRILIAIVALIVVIFLFVRFTMHESRPTVINENGDQLANKMLSAVNQTAWDTVKYMKWTFPGNHQYVWDRTANDAIVKWDDIEVHLNMDEISGKAFKNGEELVEGALDKAIQTAWSYWCNDSFWLSAPFKIFDKGTTRKIAKDKDDKEGLLITYESGGVTPGDQYLWFIDDSGLPTGYKMWVKIIPVGGVYASWEDWTTIDGAKLASEHVLSIASMKVTLSDIAGGQSWSDVGFDSDPIKI